MKLARISGMSSCSDIPDRVKTSLTMHAIRGRGDQCRGTIEDRILFLTFRYRTERGNSLFTTLMHVSWKDSKINILDTPGFDDFVGEVVSALRWRFRHSCDDAECPQRCGSGHRADLGAGDQFIPSIFVINQMDHEKADFDVTLNGPSADSVPRSFRPVPYNSEHPSTALLMLCGW